MYQVSKSGRTYQNGKATGDDLRRLIIDKCLAAGGDRISGHLPTTYTAIANKVLVTANTVSKIWRRFCTDMTDSPLQRGGDFCSKLSAGDLELIETLKNVKGSMSLQEVYSVLEDFGDVGGDISISSISRAIKTKLLSGQRYSRKRITHVALERFTEGNMLYTQLFINYLSSKPPRKIKFFDESGVKTPDIGTRRYGHAPVGKRCVEVIRKVESPNVTLNLLVSLDGPVYFNIEDGSTNTAKFLNFFFEASEATNMFSGRPAIEVGDIIVMDNLAVHHYDGGYILEEYLEEMGVELIFTPTYSPDLNPVEMCFAKVKAKLNGELSDAVHENLKLAVMDAIETITSSDMAGYYRATSYMFPDLE
jgi:transposase